MFYYEKLLHKLNMTYLKASQSQITSKLRKAVVWGSIAIPFKLIPTMRRRAKSCSRSVLPRVISLRPHRLHVSTRFFFPAILYRQINFPSERAASSSSPAFFAASRDLREAGDMSGIMKFLDLVSGRE